MNEFLTGLVLGLVVASGFWWAVLRSSRGNKFQAAAIANEALRLLRAQGLDCVGGGYDDVADKIHTAVLHAARDRMGGD